MTVAEIDGAAVRETFGVKVDISVPDASVDLTDTARVTLALRAVTGADRRLTYERRNSDRNEFRAQNVGVGAFLLPADIDLTAPDVGCPVVEGPNLACGIPMTEATATVPADGALRWTYDLVVPSTNLDRGTCLWPGRYQYQRRFT